METDMENVGDLIERVGELETRIRFYEEANERMLSAVNELNNLLAAMKGHAEWARMDPTPETNAALIDVVLTTVLRAQQVVRNTARTHAAAVGGEAPPATVLHPVDASILVADDEDLIRGLLCNLLVKVGYDVSAAGSGREAIDVCRTKSFDAVLMDFRLGDMDGVAALRQIRETQPDVRVLFLTGDPSIEEVQATVFREGADGFITKPFELEEIQEAVRHILGIPQ